MRDFTKYIFKFTCKPPVRLYDFLNIKALLAAAGRQKFIAICVAESAR